MTAREDSCRDNDSKPEPSGQDEECLRMAELEGEARSMSKYGQNVRSGRTLLLQKKLYTVKTYFDSADHNTAKSRGQNPRVPPVFPQNPTGVTIPTVESLPLHKASLVQSKLATGPS